VTVGGQSAGAANTHVLTASPLAKGLFRGAIAESGSGVAGEPNRKLGGQEQIGLKFAAAKGASDLRPHRGTTPSADWPASVKARDYVFTEYAYR